jgi:hypothetical protein
MTTFSFGMTFGVCLVPLDSCTHAIPAGLTGTVFVNWFDPDNDYDPNVDSEIMTHEWIFSVTVSSSVLTLSSGQIKRIQSYDYPH